MPLHYTTLCIYTYAFIYLFIYLTSVEYRNVCTRISAMLTTFKVHLPDLKVNSNCLLPSKTLYLPPEVPHGSNKWVLDISTTNSACEVIHVHSPDHRSSVSVVLNPMHFVPDRSLIIKPNPLVPLHCIWHLHLIVPDIWSTIPQHFTHLWHRQFEQIHSFDWHYRHVYSLVFVSNSLAEQPNDLWQNQQTQTDKNTKQWNANQLINKQTNKH